MSIKCGNHTEPTRHGTVADVRACFAGQLASEAAKRVAAYENAGWAEEADDAREEQVAVALAHATYGPDAYVCRLTADEERVLAQMAASVGGDAEAKVERYRELWRGDEARNPAPVATTPATTTPATTFFGFAGDATDKQVSFIGRLLADKDLSSLPNGWVVELEDRIHTADLGKRDASKAIDALLPLGKGQAAREAAPAAPTAPAVDETLAYTDGIFRNPNTGEIFKGQFNRAQGDGRRLYFKRLRLVVDAETSITNIALKGQREAGRAADLRWDYAGGPQKAGVKQAWLMTREEAAAFGELYGVCVRCHRDLTAEESIERAMGKICAGKQGW